jgi:hypothetical protein
MPTNWINAHVQRNTLRTIIVSIIVNSALSWTILPLFIPPFRFYTLGELMEVLFWQGVGMIGWPLALLFGLFNTLVQRSLTDLGTMILVLIYPAVLYLLIHLWRQKRLNRVELILLHLFITVSFAAVWYKVLNGYDFMAG